MSVGEGSVRSWDRWTLRPVRTRVPRQMDLCGNILSPTYHSSPVEVECYNVPQVCGESHCMSFSPHLSTRTTNEERREKLKQFGK